LLGCFVTELLIVATEKLFGFGDRVRKAREIAGFSTQKKLADALGIAQGTVGNWESGTNTPTLHQAMGLAKVLNVPVESLFGEEDRGAHGLALETVIRAIVQEEIGMLAKKLPLRAAVEVARAIQVGRKPESEPQSPPVSPPPGAAQKQ
jgi:transcriptional regulator with XRE-family HTH domain